MLIYDNFLEDVSELRIIQPLGSDLTSNLKSVTSITYISMCILLTWFGPFYDGLRGHYSLQAANEVKFNLRFEISDFNYLHIHVHIDFMVWAPF